MDLSTYLTVFSENHKCFCNGAFCIHRPDPGRAEVKLRAEAQLRTSAVELLFLLLLQGTEGWYLMHPSAPKGQQLINSARQIEVDRISKYFLLS